MSRHALRATVAVAAVSLSVLGPPVRAHDTPSTQELADLRARAEAGEAQAQFTLGRRYSAYESGPQDAAEAVRWYRLAAEQGEAIAQNILGFAYSNGRGVPQDDAEAIRWYRLAAEQGEAIAQHILGLMYSNGRGVPQDYVSAHMWLNVAAATGDEDARKARENVAASMTREQIAEAQARAREWANR